MQKFDFFVLFLDVSHLSFICYLIDTLRKNEKKNRYLQTTEANDLKLLIIKCAYVHFFLLFNKQTITFCVCVSNNNYRYAKEYHVIVFIRKTLKLIVNKNNVPQDYMLRTFYVIFCIVSK